MKSTQEFLNNYEKANRKRQITCSILFGLIFSLCVWTLSTGRYFVILENSFYISVIFGIGFGLIVNLNNRFMRNNIMRIEQRFMKRLDISETLYIYQSLLNKKRGRDILL